MQSSFWHHQTDRNQSPDWVGFSLLLPLVLQRHPSRHTQSSALEITFLWALVCLLRRTQKDACINHVSHSSAFLAGLVFLSRSFLRKHHCQAFRPSLNFIKQFILGNKIWEKSCFRQEIIYRCFKLKIIYKILKDQEKTIRATAGHLKVYFRFQEQVFRFPSAFQQKKKLINSQGACSKAYERENRGQQ